MTTRSRLSDTLKCMLVNAPGGVNLAVPTEVVHGSRPLRRSTLWRDSLSSRHSRTVVTEWDGLKLRGLVSAGMLNGPRAWRIDRLYLPGLDRAVETATSTGLELLEAVARAAGQQSAERVFLRVPSDSPVVTLAQRTGYFAYYEEVHLRGRPESINLQINPQVNPQGGHSGQELPPLSPVNHEDEFALFQLYCAATPPQVRAGTGLTLDQWRDGQEGQGRNITEETTWDSGRMTGWLALSVHENVSSARVLHRPDHPEVLPSLLAAARGRPGEQSWLVPDYQESIGTMLLRHGLREIGRYTMLVKTVAVPVVSREYSMAEA